ncbi:formylglycine-generating enzyme family protein [Thalassospira mesophila]|uniref:Nitrate reductase n=1 Tax=Thalassospira mesophila TaxID=1293891 RepID=A0A1Y2KYA0_9PROT|nr:SUMF1/EgtB/PvdO family nonheme iron enzyme [Thalassospira mesophila]OSQ37445.1 nitrate reductase [Thalassospira mesophila]
MKPTATQAGSRATHVAVAGLLAVVMLIGAACQERGPDLRYVPQMAEHPVTLPDGHKIYVQKYELSIAEWNACHNDGACSEKRRPPVGRDPAKVPATDLNHLDVSQYLAWVNAKSRHPFRLPTTKEWAFMAAKVLPEKHAPAFTSPELKWASTYLTADLPPRALRDQGSFSTTAEGIADLDGSVWEWTDDCYAGNENAAPVSKDRCPAFYAAGEHMAVIPYLVRDPARGGCAVGTPPAHLGFRLVTDKNPL